MLVTPQFVYLHTMKTGGHWARGVLLRCPGPVRNITGRGQHRGLLEIPEDLRDRPVIVFVRNPWDWWVSYFFFLKQRPPPGHRAMGMKRFPATPEGVVDALRAFMEASQSQQWRMVADDHDRVPDHVHVVRFENLRDGLRNALEAVGVEISPRLAQAIETRAPLNRTKHEHYSTYFVEQEHVALLATHEAKIIERFGYRFERD
jgi:hypothetical protein